MATQSYLNRRLEDLTCGICGKLLSVKPIKTYNGRLVKCGRCSQEGDDGVLSELNNYDENRLFKCINRFAGCRKLLTSSQVRAHEETCQEYFYPCPYCPWMILQSFRLEEHFMQYHSLSVLEKPVIRISYGFTFRVFLYKLNDFLFFVDCNVDPETGLVEANCTPVGDPSVVLQYFDITMETSSTIEPMEELHLRTNVQAIQQRFDPKSDFNKTVTVTFMYDVIATPLYEPLQDEVLLESQEMLEELRIVRSFENFQVLCARLGFTWPLKFDVPGLPENMFMSDDFLYVTLLEDSVCTKIFMNCFKCFTNTCNTPLLGGFTKINGNAFFLCIVCFLIERKEKKMINYSGYCSNSLVHLRGTYPNGTDCYSVSESPDFDQDCNKCYECPFLTCEVSDNYKNVGYHLRDVHSVPLNTFPFHIVDLRPFVHEVPNVLQVVVFVMPFFAVVSFAAKDNGWGMKIKFAHREIVPKQIRLKVALYNMENALTHIIYENTELNFLPMEKIQLSCQLDYCH